MPLSVKTSPALLWGLCMLFAVEINANDDNSSNTTWQLTTAHVLNSDNETQPATGGAVHEAAGVSVAPAESTALPTVERVKTDSTAASTPDVSVVSSAAATSSWRGPHSTAAVTKAAGEATSSQPTTIATAAEHTEDRFDRQSTTTAPGTASEAPSESSPQPTSVTLPESTSESSTAMSSTAMSSTAMSSDTQKLSSATTFTATTVTTTATSEEVTSKFDLTSSPDAITERSVSTEPPSQSTSLFSTSQSPHTTGPSSASTSISTEPPNSTTPVGIFIPGEPKKLPDPPTKAAPATTAAAAPGEGPKSPSSTKVQPCSTRGVVKKCLIIIACLAGLATIFLVSTIVLCTKLSGRKYRARRPQEATEMMCISALLPERTHNYTRQRNPPSNGVLVIPRGGDSDDDGGDNLTLSSFLPENDRYV